MIDKPIMIGDPKAPVVERNIFGDPYFDPPIVLVDMAGGVEKSVVTKLREAGGGTVFEIIEMQRHAEPILKQIVDRLAEQFTLSIPAIRMNTLRRMWLDGDKLKVQDIPSWRFYKPVQLPQWRPQIRRPQQRSASMRKHARIVRSRMTPNERRRRQASWERMKRKMAAAGIVNPNASKFWKDFFQ